MTNYNSRDIAANVLNQVIFENAYANIALNKALNAESIEKRDRNFITNLVYGSLKRWTPVEYQLEQCLNKPLKKKDAFLGILLHIGIFELLFTATPPRAAVNETVKLAKKHGHQGWGNLANGILRNLERKKESLSWCDFKDEIDKELFFQSLPVWLGHLWRKERGEVETLALLKSFETVRPLSFRINSLKTTREKFKRILDEKGIPYEEGKYSPYAIKSTSGNDITRTSQYREGFCTVQEEGSQLAVLALDPQPEASVLDMCAAPGGKTAMIAQLMNNQGSVAAGDIHEHKIKLIEGNARRLEISIVDAVVKDGKLWGEECKESFGYVLLDAPCSGLGVISRRQDARFHKSENDILALQKMQRGLIDSAVKALKVGGRMVYSTCTLTNAENHENRSYILETYPQMKSVDLSLLLAKELDIATLNQGYLELLPYVHETDGFYIAVFTKESD